MYLHLSDAMKQRAMTTTRLASVSGISKSTINRCIKNPSRNLSITTVVKLAHALEYQCINYMAKMNLSRGEI